MLANGFVHSGFNSYEQINTLILLSKYKCIIDVIYCDIWKMYDFLSIGTCGIGIAITKISVSVSASILESALSKDNTNIVLHHTSD